MEEFYDVYAIMTLAPVTWDMASSLSLGMFCCVPIAKDRYLVIVSVKHSRALSTLWEQILPWDYYSYRWLTYSRHDPFAIERM